MDKITMDKINFKNNQEPALNETNLNQLQTNIENAINQAMIQAVREARNLKADGTVDTTQTWYIDEKTKAMKTKTSGTTYVDVFVE